MRYLSVCSGIEAATVAWESLGWTPVGFSEIEPFPSVLLDHYYEDVPNYGDLNEYKTWAIDRGSVDVIIGGTPCQAFSIAGLRKGLDDPRGNLALAFVGLVDKLQPEWIIWENVPGALSVNKGRDFGTFLAALAEIGYSVSYRILDAQYFGVPQRRRRIILVGHRGADWRPSAAVLFESSSFSRDNTKSQRAKQNVATGAGGSVGISNSEGYGGIPCLTSSNLMKGVNNQTPLVYESHPNDSRVTGPVDVCPTVAARWGTGGNNTPLVQSTIALAENTIGRQPHNGGNGNGYTVDGPMYTLNATGVHGIAYTFNPSAVRLGNDIHLSEVTQTLLASQAKNGDNQPLVLTAHAFEPGSIARNAGPSGISELCPTLRAEMGDNQPAVLQQPTMTVRRLTPTECERLQGFPDNYTNISFYRRNGYIYPERYGKYHHPDGKVSKLVNASDSARYKALGNSMAIPVITWVGRRIQMCSDILKSTR